MNHFLVLIKKKLLFQKSLIENLDSLKQKDDLIINLRYSLKQHIDDLDKANEILLQSESKIDTLQSEINYFETSNRELVFKIEQELRKNKVIFRVLILSLNI